MTRKPDYPKRPPLTYDELNELFVHLLTLQSVFEASRSQFDLFRDFFFDHEGYAALWGGAAELYGGEAPELPLSITSLRAVTSARLKLSWTNDAELLIEIFGDEMPRWIIEAFPDLDMHRTGNDVGFFTMLQKAREDGLDEQRGFELLRLWIYQTGIYGWLRETTLHPQLMSPEHLIEEIQSRYERFGSINPTQVQSFGQQWDTHTQGLQQFRGRNLVGLRTGMNRLDRNTLGLRELILLAAAPGAGKTANAIAMTLGVCRHHEDNDAVVIFVSLEMPREAILNRIKCNLGDIDYRNLMFGSTSQQHRNGQGEAALDGEDAPCDQGHVITWFDEDDRDRLDDMEQQREESQLDELFILLDRDDIKGSDFAQQIIKVVKDAKESANATRALVVIDYLQLIPVPHAVESQGELVADRYRVAALQEILSSIKTGPLPDCVLAISEARKPGKANGEWGGSMAELMGTARLGYAASAVLLLRPLKDEDLVTHYPTREVDELRASHRELGIVPVEMRVAKGRDGMNRTSWVVEFKYNRNRFREIDDQSSVDAVDTTVRPSAASIITGQSSNASRRRRRRTPR